MQWMMDSWRATVWFAQGYRHYMKEGFLAKQKYVLHDMFYIYIFFF
jgi:hypothetical protein